MFFNIKIYNMKYLFIIKSNKIRSSFLDHFIFTYQNSLEKDKLTFFVNLTLLVNHKTVSLFFILNQMPNILLNSFSVVSQYLLIWLSISLIPGIYILHFVNSIPIPCFYDSFDLIIMLNIPENILNVFSPFDSILSIIFQVCWYFALWILYYDEVKSIPSSYNSDLCMLQSDFYLFSGESYNSINFIIKIYN